MKHYSNTEELKKNIDADHHAFYEAVRDRQPLFGINYVLFFDLDPQSCLERIGIRGNNEEFAYQLLYFEMLDQVYFQQVLDTIEHEQCPIIVVPPLPLDLQTQIIHVLERVHTRVWTLPTVMRIQGKVIPDQLVHAIDTDKSLSELYEKCHARVPDPYLGDQPVDEDYPLCFNYALYADHPNQFLR